MTSCAAHILLLAHAPLASALREAALHVFPDCAPFLHALDVPANEAPEVTLAHARALLDAATAPTHGTACAPLLVMTDVLGATPSNVAQRLLGLLPQPDAACLLTGANLPMLLRALGYRHLAGVPPQPWAQMAIEGAQRGITLVTAPPLAGAE